MLIPISDITILPDRQRRVMDQKKLESLARSIKERGLIHHIVVRQPLAEDVERNGEPVTTPYVLVAGGRRTAAHLLLGLDKIGARILEDLSPIEQEKIELEENLEREDITWQERVSATTRIHELEMAGDKNHTQEKTAEKIGVSKANLSKDLALNTMMQHDPELKKASTKRGALRLAQHKLTLAHRILNLSENTEEDLRKKLFCADAKDFIRTLPDNSADLIFTDLPYDIDYKSTSDIGAKSHVMGKYEMSAEEVRDFVTDLVPQMCRVLKPTGWMVLFFSIEGMNWLRERIQEVCVVHGEYTGFCAPLDKTLKGECRYVTPEPIDWIWYRPNSRNVSQWPDRHANHFYEKMLVVNGGEARMIIQNQPDVLMHEAVYSDRLHEMQKPHSLCVDVIRRLTIPGQLVVDFTMGSGAHLAAAAELKRDFLGCDNNPDNLGSAIGLVSQFYKKAE